MFKSARVYEATVATSEGVQWILEAVFYTVLSTADNIFALLLTYYSPLLFLSPLD
jgi:hypothetical protein